MELRRYKWVEIFSLIVFAGITILALLEDETSIFYIIYLFWMDEFVKTIFDGLQYYLNKKRITDPKAFRAILNGRFFMLLIYVVFIIVLFGFVMDWGNQNAIILNLEVLFFKNTLFNLTVFGFLIREIIQYLDIRKKLLVPIHPIMSKAMMTLHISIILGVFIWALLSGKFGVDPINLGVYQTVAAITPFLLIKLFFEISEIKVRFREIQNINNI